MSSVTSVSHPDILKKPSQETPSSKEMTTPPAGKPTLNKMTKRKKRQKVYKEGPKWGNAVKTPIFLPAKSKFVRTIRQASPGRQ